MDYSVSDSGKQCYWDCINQEKYFRDCFETKRHHQTCFQISYLSHRIQEYVFMRICLWYIYWFLFYLNQCLWWSNPTSSSGLLLFRNDFGSCDQWLGLESDLSEETNHRCCGCSSLLDHELWWTDSFSCWKWKFWWYHSWSGYPFAFWDYGAIISSVSFWTIHFSVNLMITFTRYHWSHTKHPSVLSPTDYWYYYSWYYSSYSYVPWICWWACHPTTSREYLPTNPSHHCYFFTVKVQPRLIQLNLTIQSWYCWSFPEFNQTSLYSFNYKRHKNWIFQSHFSSIDPNLSYLCSINLYPYSCNHDSNDKRKLCSHCCSSHDISWIDLQCSKCLTCLLLHLCLYQIICRSSWSHWMYHPWYLKDSKCCNRESCYSSLMDYWFFYREMTSCRICVWENLRRLRREGNGRVRLMLESGVLVWIKWFLKLGFPEWVDSSMNKINKLY